MCWLMFLILPHYQLFFVHAKWDSHCRKQAKLGVGHRSIGVREAIESKQFFIEQTSKDGDEKGGVYPLVNIQKAIENGY